MINKFFDYFKIDGCKHIIISAILVIVLKLFMSNLAAVTIVLLIGVVKEFIYDKYLGKGYCEKKDIIADIVGIIIGVL